MKRLPKELLKLTLVAVFFLPENQNDCFINLICAFKINVLKSVLLVFS